MAVGLDLDQYQLKNRVLLVFAPDEQDVRYEEQREYLHDDSGAVDESRLVVAGVFERGPSFIEDRPLSHGESERAREKFGVEEGRFALHLLGLDGTEILRATEPVPADELIRAMAPLDE